MPSLQVLLAAFVVTFGFFVGVTPDSAVAQQLLNAPSRTSIIYGVLSSLFIAIHAVLIKSSLPHANNSTIQLAYWQNLGSVIFLAPFIFFQGELSTLSQLLNAPEWNAQVFMWGSLVTGVFGFLLCVAGLLSIKVTSPVTHMFSSVSLDCYCHSTNVLIDLALPPSDPARTAIVLLHLALSRLRVPPSRRCWASGSSAISSRRKWLASCVSSIGQRCPSHLNPHPPRSGAYFAILTYVLTHNDRHRLASILIIAAGTVNYTWVKSTEAANAPPRPASAPKNDIEAARPLAQIDEEVYDMQEKKARPA